MKRLSSARPGFPSNLSVPRSLGILLSLVIVSIAGYAFIARSTIRTTLMLNLGWVSVTKGLLATQDESGYYAQRAEQYFAQALNLGVDDQLAQDRRSLLGLGLSKYLAGKGTEARAVWIGGAVNFLDLVALGDSAVARNQWTSALFYYESAAPLVVEKKDAIRIQNRIDFICQQVLLSNYEPAEPFMDACQAWYAGDHNLLVNGDFAASDLAHWVRRGGSDLAYTVEVDATGAPVAKITNTSGARYAGIFQPLPLSPGTQIEFRARLRVESQEPLEITPLYVRIERPDGYWRNAADPIPPSAEWVEITKTFEIPETLGNPVLIYPAFFRGKGTVWIAEAEVWLK